MLSVGFRENSTCLRGGVGYCEVKDTFPMACSKEELDISDEGLCPICSDNYKAPRRLPTCGHTFCENCLFTFVFDLKEQGNVDTTFDCPVCRQPYPFQSSREVVLDLIKTFARVPDPVEVDKGSCDVGSEEGGESRKCGLCEDVGVVMCGKKFCLGCQAYICDGCVEIHKKVKAIRSHTLLDVRETVNCEYLLSEFNKFKKCCRHPDRDVELFCRDDETFICSVCASTVHKNCRDVVEASECSEEGKYKVEELKKRIVETQKHLDTLQQLSCQTSTSVKTQTETVVREITDSRSKIVNSLDSLVENMAKRTKQILHDVNDKESAIAGSVERLKALYDKKLLGIDSVNKYGSTPEVFLFSEQLEAEIEKLEEEVLMLDSTLETSDVDRGVADLLNKISEQLEPSKIPEIAIVNKASDQQPKYTLPKRQSTFQVGKVERHKVILSDKPSPTFNGITVAYDGTLILSESYYGHLGLYDPDQKKKYALKMNEPYSATMIDRQTIATTMNSDKNISIVSLRFEMRIEKSLDTKHNPMCITSLSDSKVAISWQEPPGFSIADVSGSTLQESQYFTQDSDGRKFQSFDFMAINEPRKLVIQPCSKDKAVYCFDFTGKPVFKYTNNLKTPKGVTVDIKTGNVFMCDNSDACIHQLSARGQPISVIRHRDLTHPLNVCYDKRRKCLWVTHETSEKWDIVSCLVRA